MDWFNSIWSLEEARRHFKKNILLEIGRVNMEDLNNPLQMYFLALSEL